MSKCKLRVEFKENLNGRIHSFTLDDGKEYLNFREAVDSMLESFDLFSGEPFEVKMKVDIEVLD